ncbi:MAG: response regulator transcription factor [Magnetococcales bacterium]|nr:response regulator transcription factor [Magnetococcales bacterium]MBF0114261.1 response regulator transcription factor [Magnetococcales bacterium]
MNRTVLIVEDEADLLKALVFNLRKGNYAVRQAMNGQQALREVLRAPRPDLVILDLQLPDMTGLEICRRIRADPTTRSMAVLILTARGEEIDRLIGFEMGADDYMVKPFSIRELLMRVQALLRRTTQSYAETSPQVIRFGLLRIDPDAFRVWINDEEIQLTSMEFKLLITLLERRGRLQTRDVLLNDVWGIDSYVRSRTVDVHIKRLREKLGQVGEYIETIHGMGYRLRSAP